MSGKRGRRSYGPRKQRNFRCSDDLFARVSASAARRGLTFNAEVIRILDAVVDNEEVGAHAVRLLLIDGLTLTEAVAELHVSIGALLRDLGAYVELLPEPAAREVLLLAIQGRLPGSK